MSTNFPVSLDVYAVLDGTSDVLFDHPNDRGDAIEAIEAKLGIDSSSDATSIDYLLKHASSVDPGHQHSVYGNFIASGRKLFLYENTSPTGWTTVAVTDAVLAVKGGSQAYNVTGGQTAGTWTQPSHTLITSEIPVHSHSHNHQMGSRDSTAGDSSSTGGREFIQDYGYAGSGYGVASTSSTDATNAGSGGSHAHGTTYRPAAAIGIISQKD